MNKKTAFLIFVVLFAGAFITIANANFLIKTKMPGENFSSEPLPLDSLEKRIKSRLYSHVEHLSVKIGSRVLHSYHEGILSLTAAADYIDKQFQDIGYNTKHQEFTVADNSVINIEAEIKGSRKPEEILIIGAHYDTMPDTPGADDNASAVAGLIEIARELYGSKPDITIRFVAFANEEVPYFHTDNMGSLIYAKRSRERKENIIGMICLEMIGFYSDEKGSQQYPFPLNHFYPDTGKFISFVANNSSKQFLFIVIEEFRKNAAIPSEGVAAPEALPGIGWSDHWSFWQAGYPALMVTDTSFYRNPHYHKTSDTIDTLDFDNMTRVVSGLIKAIKNIADGSI